MPLPPGPGRLLTLLLLSATIYAQDCARIESIPFLLQGMLSAPLSTGVSRSPLDQIEAFYTDTGIGAQNGVSLRQKLRDCSRLQMAGQKDLRRAAADFAYEASRRVAVADLNGDGNPDAIMAGLVPDTVSVFLGVSTPKGAIGPATEYPAGSNPESIVLDDLNGDGTLDLAVTNSEAGEEEKGAIAVLLGTGGGAFGKPVSYTAGLHPRSIASGDFNSDGKADLAVANFGGYLSTGDPGSVSLLLGQGDGAFREAVNYPANRNPWSLVVLDVNADGRLDVIAVNYRTNDVSFLPGDGAGALGAPTHSAVGVAPAYIGLADFNLDGRWDLAVLLPESSTLAILVGNGAGSFQSPDYYLTGYSPRSFAFFRDSPTSPPGVLAPGMLGGGVMHINGAGDGKFQATRAYFTGQEPRSVAAADFNRDGRLDLAVASQESRRISIFTGDGAGNLRPAGTQATPGSEGPTAIVAADFTSDGNSDVGVILTGGPESRFVSLLGRGDGTFTIGPSTSICGPPHFATVIDYNRDDKPDVAVACGDGRVALLEGQGAGRFGRTYVSTGQTTTSLTSGDFNGDGRPDLAVVLTGDLASNFGAVQILLTNTTGSGMRLGPRFEAGPFPLSAAAADFNGDGLLDLAVSAAEPMGHVETWLGSGDGAFELAVIQNADGAANSMVAGDFDGDGNADLVLAECCGETSMAFLSGNRNGTFKEGLLFPGGTDATRVVAGDFNGDQKPDLAVIAGAPTTTQGTVAVLLNNLAAPVTLLSVNAASNAAGGALAPESIASAYGSGLAMVTESASSADWPTSLGGSTVRVRDLHGVERPAQIAFVSPGQVNYVVPGSTAEGAAVVTITTPGGRSSGGSAQIVSAAPGLFNAEGVAVGYALRISGGGEQVYEDLARKDELGRIEPVPIDLGPASDQVVLLLFGTGIRRGEATAKIGEVTLAPEFAGAQGQYPGFDQVNLRLPRSLAGRGALDVVVSANGRDSNPVRIAIR